MSIVRNTARIAARTGPRFPAAATCYSGRQSFPDSPALAAYRLMGSPADRGEPWPAKSAPCWLPARDHNRPPRQGPTPDAVYWLVRGYPPTLGFEIGAHALRATAATTALDRSTRRLLARTRSGVVWLSCGSWYDPVGDGDDAACAHGNANVLTRDHGMSRLSQGPSSAAALVEVERCAMPPPVRAFAPVPVAVDG
jgi:hypothetical protein